MVFFKNIKRDSLRKISAEFFEVPAARILSSVGISPNMMTFFGLILSCIAAYFVAVHNFGLAGIALLFSGIFDLLDGTLARITGKASNFGALLDSLVDRVSEGIVLFGFLVFALNRDDTTLAMLAYVAFATSFFVSYVRSRSEGLGISGVVGIMTRPERVGVIVIGLFSGFVSVALAIIAVLSVLTTIQRLVFSSKTID
jgi:CDP-diacylglycerol--glycerol-3-phosphate 3-phosphatidyltransferase